MTMHRGRVAVVTVALLAAACADGTAIGTSPGSTTSTMGQRPLAGPTSSAPRDEDTVRAACAAQRSRVDVMGADLRVPPMRSLVTAFDDDAGVAVHPVQAGMAPPALRLVLQASVAAAPSPRPDLVQIDLSTADVLGDDGLLAPGALEGAVSPDVPVGLVGDEGEWVAPWLATVAFVVVDRAVADDDVPTPRSFADLAEARRLTVSLPGDPRRETAPLAAVMAASLASGGSIEDLLPGVDYMSRLRRQRRLVVEDPDVYLELGAAAVSRRDALAALGIPATIVYPTDGVVAVPTVLAAVRGAARPACAVQWVRDVLSDDAARVIAASGLVPARWAAPGAMRQHPAAERRTLPPADVWSAVQVLTASSVVLGREVLRDAWRDRVGEYP